MEGRTTVELELKLPNSKVIPFSQINVIHVSSTLKESIFGPAENVTMVKAPSTDFVDNLLRFAFSEGTPKLRFRLGIGLPGDTFYLPWQEHIITDYAAELEGLGDAAGHYVRIVTNDHLFTASRITKVVSRRGKISDIVLKIAKEQGITNTVIESTLGEGLYIQSYIDDIAFIRARLLPRAVNAKGRGNYHLFIQDNVLHFHTPDYQATIKELVFYQNNSINLMQIDQSELLLETGASGVRIIAYDPYTGQISEVASKPAQVLRLGNVTHNLFRLKGSELNIPYHLSSNPPQEAEYIAQNAYDVAHSAMFGLKLDMNKTLFLRANDVLRITISPSSRRNSVWSGTYLVMAANHDVDKGTLKSSFTVKRGEFLTARNSSTNFLVRGQNVVQDELTAPGQDLNVKETQSSTLTKGSGQSVSTSVFVTAKDPGTAS